MSSSKSTSLPAENELDEQDPYCYLKSHHLHPKHRNNRPTSNAEEEEHFTDESELSTPRRTPSPDPDALTEEDANIILEEENLPAVPGLAADLAAKKRRRETSMHDLFHQSTLQPAAKTPQNGDPESPDSANTAASQSVPTPDFNSAVQKAARKPKMNPNIEKILDHQYKILSGELTPWAHLVLGHSILSEMVECDTSGFRASICLHGVARNLGPTLIISSMTNMFKQSPSKSHQLTTSPKVVFGDLNSAYKSIAQKPSPHTPGGRPNFYGEPSGSAEVRSASSPMESTQSGASPSAAV
ncbi:MAG: hypothetical protein L6R38_005598 [Xanthoria sp. 2 TBL-2021]|nr:MAG: hypothetical protein L6R38_005598 [Xanthoria sp. 2 TBL-2021]